MKTHLIVIPTLFAALLFFLVGCETVSLPDPYDVEIALGEDLYGASVQVDLIGIPAEELSRYASYSVTEYFEPGNQLRNETQKTTLSFRRDTGTVQLLSASDAIWSEWIESRSASYLVILADTPGLRNDAPGNLDSRRLILPLHQREWEKRPTRIQVQVTGDSVTSDPLPLETY